MNLLGYRMRVIHLRVNPIIVYLLVLTIYGMLMMLTSQGIRDLTEDEIYSHDNKDDEGESLNYNIHHRRKNHRQSWSDLPIASVEDFYNRINTTETFCKRLVDIGGSSCKRAIDFNKLYCMDDDVRMSPKSCTVYSFGIGEDMTFDYAMSTYGCEVFMFDPSVPSSMVQENLNEKLHFYQMGLFDTNFTMRFKWNWMDDTSNKTDHKVNLLGELDTFSNIQRRINHEGREVHYLKMDVDQSEWNVIPNMIKNHNFDSVKQLAIEIHALNIINKTEEQAKPILQDMWNTLSELTKLGFQRASYAPTIVTESLYWFPGRNKSIPTCGEILYIKRNSHNKIINF